MSWLGDAIGNTFGELLDGVTKLVDETTMSDEEKRRFEKKAKQLVHEQQKWLAERATQELKAKESIMVAELKQDDAYTKRARPTVVYGGLAIIALNHAIAPLLAQLAGLDVPQLTLPDMFWTAWGGVVSVYSIGRSAEKRGAKSKAVEAVTGNKTPETGLL